MAPAQAVQDPASGGRHLSPDSLSSPPSSRSAQDPGNGFDRPTPGDARRLDGRPRLGDPGFDRLGRPDGNNLTDAPPRRPRPEPKPTEFQTFVQGATGRLLPIFGSSFFDEGPAQVADQIPVAGDYTVGPGDEVQVRVWGSIDADLRAMVDRNGQIHLPRIGSFTVAGTKASDLEGALRGQIARLYTNFNLNVTLGQLRGVRVFVVGAATQVGVFSLPSPATMMSAIVAAGGPNPTGSMRRVLLKRSNVVVSELDLYDLLVSGDRSRDTQLNAGDVIVFEPAGPRVALTGSTDRAAVYELKVGGEPLANLLRYAGGAPVLADRSRAQLERVDPAQPKAPRKVETVALDGGGPQTALRDGDVLTLLAMPERFANAITLRGPVANPVRYPFVPGMRIRDLIPDRDALVPPDFVRRKNELVQVEVDPLPRDRASSSTTTALQPSHRQQPGGGAAANASVMPSGSSENGQRSIDTLVGAVRSPMLDRDGRPLDEAELQARRRIPTPLFGDINWDYAVIERLNDQSLTTEVIPFNLGRAVLQGDAEQNLALKPGDVVTVYSQRDLRGPLSRQTRLVTVDGEVQSPGVYQLQAGETLRALIQRAGGATAQAYLYGLEFSRESTRQQQRQNLASAVSRLEALAATQSARDAANRRDDAQIANVSSAATQAQLARLRQLQPNGRIALELAPTVASVNELPEVPLEHGDRISVPARPGFVTVAGAVVNSNAFLWRPDRTTGDYLKLAGVEEAADPKNTFILRADGTVTTAADNRRWFGGGLEGMQLQPGDAVIVPNQLDFETFGRALVRNLKDWSQILANFGIGAAAIKTLRQ
jgi:polysaccharide biosynthesis/export protein